MLLALYWVDWRFVPVTNYIFGISKLIYYGRMEQLEFLVAIKISDIKMKKIFTDNSVVSKKLNIFICDYKLFSKNIQYYD